MDRYGRLFDIQMILVGVTGVALTVLFAPPGEYTVDAGLFRIDPFYVFVPLFAALALWSGRDLWRFYAGSEH